MFVEFLKFQDCFRFPRQGRFSLWPSGLWTCAIW